MSFRSYVISVTLAGASVRETQEHSAGVLGMPESQYLRTQVRRIEWSRKHVKDLASK